jgi:hypothetical protein
MSILWRAPFFVSGERTITHHVEKGVSVPFICLLAFSICHNIT